MGLDDPLYVANGQRKRKIERDMYDYISNFFG
jgi:hypothetical protein